MNCAYWGNSIFINAVKLFRYAMCTFSNKFLDFPRIMSRWNSLDLKIYYTGYVTLYFEVWWSFLNINNSNEKVNWKVRRVKETLGMKRYEYEPYFTKSTLCFQEIKSVWGTLAKCLSSFNEMLKSSTEDLFCDV